MDFEPGEELQAVADLAGRIFADGATPARLAEVEATDGRLDERLWAKLAGAGLLGVALPTGAGGGGLGASGLCALLEAHGRAVAPVPVWPTVVAALAVAGLGDDALGDRVVPSIADGSARWTVALDGLGGSPTFRACQEGKRWRVSGRSTAVPAPFGAAGVLVGAHTEEGEALLVVDAGGAGVSWEPVETTAREVAGNLVLDAAAASPVGEPGDGGALRARHLTTVALAALQLGVTEAAVAQAAAYVSRREQFGRPLGTFQAVAHQLADCAIDVEALRVATWRAAEAIDAGEDLPAPALVAGWWAAEAGLNVVYRVQHVHGGIGVDVSYPVHRYFLWARQVASLLGGPSRVLAELGDVLAGSGRSEERR